MSVMVYSATKGKLYLCRKYRFSVWQKKELTALWQRPTFIESGLISDILRKCFRLSCLSQLLTNWQRVNIRLLPVRHSEQLILMVARYKNTLISTWKAKLRRATVRHQAPQSVKSAENQCLLCENCKKILSESLFLHSIWPLERPFWGIFWPLNP